MKSSVSLFVLSCALVTVASPVASWKDRNIQTQITRLEDSGLLDNLDKEHLPEALDGMSANDFLENIVDTDEFENHKYHSGKKYYYGSGSEEQLYDSELLDKFDQMDTNVFYDKLSEMSATGLVQKIAQSKASNLAYSKHRQQERSPKEQKKGQANSRPAQVTVTYTPAQSKPKPPQGNNWVQQQQPSQKKQDAKQRVAQGTQGANKVVQGQKQSTPKKQDGKQRVAQGNNKAVPDNKQKKQQHHGGKNRLDNQKNHKESKPPVQKKGKDNKKNQKQAKPAIVVQKKGKAKVTMVVSDKKTITLAPTGVTTVFAGHTYIVAPTPKVNVKNNKSASKKKNAASTLMLPSVFVSTASFVKLFAVFGGAFGGAWLVL